MSINCCKSYVGKQIIGLLPGGAEECWYLVYLDSNYLGYSNWTGWTLNGNDLVTELTAICQAQGGNVAIRDGITNASVLWGFYLGTSDTTYAAYDPANNETPISFNEVAQCEACYQFEVPYGENIKGINVANIIEFLSITAVDDEAGLETELELLFGTQVSVSSVWNGSNYIVTINNAWDPGAGISLVNSSGSEYIGSLGVCPITPPEPVSLNLFTAYPGATAGYSLRKLDASYAGSAIRVRRSSDNTEQNIGFIGMDLDTTSLSSFVGAGNGFITKWYDQSGNNRDAAQTNQAWQCKIVNAGSIITENSKPAIEFVTNTVTGAKLTITGLTTQLDSSFFVGAVVKANTQTNYKGIFTTTTSGSNGMMMLSRGGTNNWGTYGNGSYRQSNSNIQGGALTLISMQSSNGNSGNFYKNSSADGTFNDTEGQTYVGIGGQQTQEFNGKISEVIVYPTDQSANRIGIETNIKNYYGI